MLWSSRDDMAEDNPADLAAALRTFLA